MKTRNPETAALVVVLAAAVAVSGCATKKYVETELAESEARMGDRVAEVQTQVEENQMQIEEQDQRLGEASKTAQEALERAVDAGVLAEGKFLYETVLTDEGVRFGFDESGLSDGARVLLDELAVRLMEENQNVFLEIQGHTDATGSEDYNLTLGERRAQAVKRYLSMRHGVALSRMSIISYGESAPIADNGSREGRAQNRRVVIVVLK